MSIIPDRNGLLLMTKPKLAQHLHASRENVLLGRKINPTTCNYIRPDCIKTSTTKKTIFPSIISCNHCTQTFPLQQSLPVMTISAEKHLRLPFSYFNHLKDFIILSQINISKLTNRSFKIRKFPSLEKNYEEPTIIHYICIVYKYF